MENKSKELIVAIQAAKEAGEIASRYFNTGIDRDSKHDNSIVTLADKECEDTIKSTILEAFPAHSILGEETGLTKNEQHYVWHIDPIDGTRNFSNGIPLFAISIALEYGNEIILGVVYNPVLNDLFYSTKGGGAYWNDKKMSVSKDNEKMCIVTVTSGKNVLDTKLRRSLLQSMPENIISSVRDFGSAAVELAYVARGNIEATIIAGLSTYDFAAGTLLVEEAGGKILNFDGTPWKFPNKHFVACNGVFPQILIEEINKQKKILNI